MFVSDNICKDCNKEISPFKGTMVILPNTLWLKVADEMSDILCPDCIEIRLGRKLIPNDFPPNRVETYKGNQMLYLRTIPANQYYFSKNNMKVRTIN